MTTLELESDQAAIVLSEKGIELHMPSMDDDDITPDFMVLTLVLAALANSTEDKKLVAMRDAAIEYVLTTVDEED